MRLWRQCSRTFSHHPFDGPAVPPLPRAPDHHYPQTSRMRLIFCRSAASDHPVIRVSMMCGGNPTSSLLFADLVRLLLEPRRSGSFDARLVLMHNSAAYASKEHLDFNKEKKKEERNCLKTGNKTNQSG